MDIADLISQYGFPIVMAVGLGYFIYFIWNFIGEHIDPALQEMHVALIKVIDKTRMLDQDMIRLQQKGHPRRGGLSIAQVCLVTRSGKHSDATPEPTNQP